MNKSKEIVEAILDNLSGRCGIGNILEEIDNGTMVEIKEELIAIVDEIFEVGILF